MTPESALALLALAGVALLVAAYLAEGITDDRDVRRAALQWGCAILAFVTLRVVLVSLGWTL